MINDNAPGVEILHIECNEIWNKYCLQMIDGEMFIDIRHNCAFQENSKICF